MSRLEHSPASRRSRNDDEDSTRYGPKTSEILLLSGDVPRQGFCLVTRRVRAPMQSKLSVEVYSPREIAEAAGVDEHQVVALLGGRTGFVRHEDAVRLGSLLVQSAYRGRTPFSTAFLDKGGPQVFAHNGVPLAVSSTLHVVCLAAFVLVTTFGLEPKAQTLQNEPTHAEPMRLVFLATPGPGGGGGGGGLKQKPPPPKAEREGHHAVSSPLPRRDPPRAVVPTPAPPEPKPAPLKAEQLSLLRS